MRSEYLPLRRITRWISRWRRRRGYGVHSPWAFAWITQVFYCEDAYYAYAVLHDRRTMRENGEPALTGNLIEKDDRLLFRIANAARAERIALVGDVGMREEAYLRAARTHAVVQRFCAHRIDAAAVLETHDFVYADTSECLDTFSDMLSGSETLDTIGETVGRRCSSADEHCRTVLVRGIRRDALSLDAWLRFVASPAVHVSFDLGRFGLAFLAPRLHKQHYTVAFF